MPIVEFGPMGVKPNHLVFDNTTPEGQILEKAWKAVTTLPGGPYWAYGSLEKGEQDLLWGFFEFDSIEHHKTFATTHGAEAVKDLPNILTHGIFQTHVDFSSILQPVLKAPVVEVVLVYFSPEITDEQKSGIARILREGMARDIEESGANVNAWTSGWSVETDIPVTQNSTDKSGIVFALCIGWPDEERRVAFRDKYDSQTGQLKINTLAEILAVENRVMKSKEFGVRQEDE